MRRVLVVVLLLLLPQLASARMYMCVDEATGNATFTDKGCETSGTREEIRVNKINPGAGEAKRQYRGRKVWRSDAEVRKSGTDYNAERRALYEREATASTH